MKIKREEGGNTAQLWVDEGYQGKRLRRILMVEVEGYKGGGACCFLRKELA